MYTIKITGNYYGNDGHTTTVEAATASEAYALKEKFEALNLDVHVQDDSDLNKEGCYDGGFYADAPAAHYDSEEDIAYVNIGQND